MIFNGFECSTKIATGSFVGTGKYGSANPIKLTFGFQPKFVIITGDGTVGYGHQLIIHSDGSTLWAGHVNGNTSPIFSVSMCTATLTRDGVSFYGSIIDVCAVSGKTYNYLAIG